MSFVVPQSKGREEGKLDLLKRLFCSEPFDRPQQHVGLRVHVAVLRRIPWIHESYVIEWKTAAHISGDPTTFFIRLQYFSHLLFSTFVFFVLFRPLSIQRSAPEILLSCFRALGRYFAMTALILQIAGTYGCGLLSKQPYGIPTSFHNHGDVFDVTGDRCTAFGTAGIALSGADATYNFAKWMVSYVCIQGTTCLQYR